MVEGFSSELKPNNMKKFTGRVYHFKNGETRKESGYTDIDPYLFSKFDNVVKIDLIIAGEKRETLKPE